MASASSNDITNSAQAANKDTGKPSTSEVTSHLGSARDCSNKVLLATVWVKYNCIITVSGIGTNHTATVQATTNLLIGPIHQDGPCINIRALILKRLTSYQAIVPFSSDQWEQLKELEWADFYASSTVPIDLIIAQETIFGWVLTSPIQTSNVEPDHINVLHSDIYAEINENIKRFWEIEASPEVSFLSEEDKICEEHFTSTHSRRADGKYVVRLPFKTESPIAIGFSQMIATRSFHQIEKRLEKNPELASEYHAFLKEYLALGHMLDRGEINLQSTQNVFLSHYPVIRQDSSTTRLRVVFNASMRTTNSSTLNDHLLVGPKLQADINAIILRWRSHRFVIAADIAKMFKQIWINPRDTHYQFIVWRENSSDSLKTYELQTVTYGTASAPFIANRVIKQLATDEGTNFPLAVPILNDQIYVDDLLFGADDKALALQLRNSVSVSALLKCDGFHLRKWASNCSQLLAGIPNGDHELASSRPFQEIDGLETLGLFWSTCSDKFQFNFKIEYPENSRYTKRLVLSTIARMFDPLGWTCPVIITAKIFMQKLWMAKLNWDDPLTFELHKQWDEYSSDLKQLRSISIPRWLGLSQVTLNCEIHGFSDASLNAYAAVVFLRVGATTNHANVHLLMAKTKVTPLKPLTIPRLELSASVIMARLIEYIQSTLRQNCPVYCWTDSAVALAWIHKHPSRLKTFAAHRVAEIQGSAINAIWRHVPSEFNPADCASRGLSATQLEQRMLWWSGPPWLSCPPEEWPESTPNPPSEVETEIKREVKTLHSQAITE
ncbi:uncharacterized protein LOC108630706 [Ceratina calcarata]|uniref:Uncharacterized protein LOC108630706 n=1 Tax=Ceratina calcarata TaxID=156304 RepID=A0AAJ7JBV3_9HYME|nr:uncharacterized protein LOC108630706 [Ceratina calcarata]